VENNESYSRNHGELAYIQYILHDPASFNLPCQMSSDQNFINIPVGSEEWPEETPTTPRANPAQPSDTAVPAAAPTALIYPNPSPSHGQTPSSRAPRSSRHSSLFIASAEPGNSVGTPVQANICANNQGNYNNTPSRSATRYNLLGAAGSSSLQGNATPSSNNHNHPGSNNGRGRHNSLALGDLEAEKKAWNKNLDNLAQKSKQSHYSGTVRKGKLIAANHKLEELFQELSGSTQQNSSHNNSSSNLHPELLSNAANAPQQNPAISSTLGPQLLAESDSFDHSAAVQRRAIRGKLARQSLSITNWRPYDKNKRTEVINAEISSDIPIVTTNSQVNQRSSAQQAKTNYQANNFDEFRKSFFQKKNPKSSDSGATMQTKKNSNNSQSHNAQDLKEIKLRSHPWAQKLGHMQTTPLYFALSLLLCFYSLFIWDICITSLPKTADSTISGTLFGIFLLLSCEIVLNSFIKANYLFSFLFFLDIVGTFTLLFDVDFILNGIFNQQPGLSAVNHSTNVLRITKITRVLRVLRLIRVVRIFKFNASVVNYYTNNTNHSSNGDNNNGGSGGENINNNNNNVSHIKVGIYLSELLDKRMIVMVFVMLIVLPFLQPSNDTFDSALNSLGLDLLNSPEINLSAQQSIVQVFLSYNSNCIYLKIFNSLGSNLYLDELQQFSYLRNTEFQVLEWDKSICVISVRDAVYWDALYSILLTLLVTIMFSLATLIISQDIKRLIIDPLERLQLIIKKLASTVCFLSINSDNEPADGLETHLIEGIIRKMANIFNVEPDIDSGAPKPLQLITGSKLTEIQTTSSVVSIEVVERPRLHEIEDAALKIDHTYGQQHWAGHINIPAELSAKNAEIHAFIPPDPLVHRELASMENILSFQPLFPHFKLYLESALLVENLLFFQEVDRFRSIIRLHCVNLYNSFISAKAVNPINLSAKQREEIRERLPEPAVSLFDAAENEVLQLMQGHVGSFLHSKFCQAYLRNRRTKHIIPHSKIHGSKWKFSAGTEPQNERRNKYHLPESEINEPAVFSIITETPGQTMELFNVNNRSNNDLPNNNNNTISAQELSQPPQLGFD
jgi:hypothetical protein